MIITLWTATRQELQREMSREAADLLEKPSALSREIRLDFLNAEEVS
ncbi:MAG: hypothetical protein WBB96_10385 [Candidatus Dechloromonas phosphoritropha]|jgi:hypothetical protein|nr:hypothetical protein [Azonexus sp.]MBP9226859.1 hypothetical protein [Azonexus sp.]